MMFNKFIYSFIDFIPDWMKRAIKKSRIYRHARKMLVPKHEEGNYVIRGGLLRNFTIFTDPERSGYILGYYELDITRTLLEFCKPGMVVCDIGAHHGYFSLLMSKLIMESGHCYAFEALKNNYEKITQTIKANGIVNITIENVAISDQPGMVDFRIYPGFSSMGKLVNYVDPHQQEQFSESETVRAISLDLYFSDKGNPHIGLLKIDVEGAEDVVIDGAKSIIERDKPVIVMEVHNCKGLDVEFAPVVASLISSGYQIKELINDQEGGINKHILAW